jgi:hypothetical protein
MNPVAPMPVFRNFAPLKSADNSGIPLRARSDMRSKWCRTRPNSSLCSAIFNFEPWRSLAVHSGIWYRKKRAESAGTTRIKMARVME